MKLRLVDLTKKFFSLRGDIIALNNINLEIQDNEFFVLLGPSGCGKTTLLNLIAGLEKPTYGEVWFDDRLIATKGVFLSPRERNVAMVFQSYALYPHLNVFENIAFPLKISGVKKRVIKEKVENIASMLEISNLLAAKPGELSGGQRQRVAIARAIVRHPDIFLLDEPLSNLDAQMRLFMRTELKNLQRRLGITTIYVTHDQIEAMTLGDRIAVLKDGKVEQIDTPEELYEKPVNTFVATFIGSPPMNLLEVSFIEKEAMFYILIDGKRIKLPNNKVMDLKKLRGKSCIFGIRPEDIYVNPVKAAQSLRARISSLEPMGREILLHVTTGEHKLSILTTDTGFKEGGVIDVEINCKRAHIFEKRD